MCRFTTPMSVSSVQRDSDQEIKRLFIVFIRVSVSPLSLSFSIIIYRSSSILHSFRLCPYTSMNKQDSGDESDDDVRNGDYYNLPDEFPYDDYFYEKSTMIRPKKFETPV